MKKLSAKQKTRMKKRARASFKNNVKRRRLKKELRVLESELNRG